MILKANLPNCSTVVVSTDQVDHCGVFQLFKIFRHGLCFTLSFSMIRNTVYKAYNVSYCLLVQFVYFYAAVFKV